MTGGRWRTKERLVEGMLRGTAVVAGVLIFAIAMTACDPSAEITWVNETDQTVNVHLGDDLDDFDVSLPPHTSKRVETIEAVWEDVVVVRDREGGVILRQEITWDELEEQGFRFVIRSTGE